MNNFVINKYLVTEFFKSFLNVVLVFCCLGLILNLFEEIKDILSCVSYMQCFTR